MVSYVDTNEFAVASNIGLTDPCCEAGSFLLLNGTNRRGLGKIKITSWCLARFPSTRSPRATSSEGLDREAYDLGNATLT